MNSSRRGNFIETSVGAFVIVTAALLGACATSAGITVSTDYDRAAQFGKYKTYALSPPTRGHKMAEGSEAALRDALRGELSQRGIAEAPGGKADLNVVRHVFVEARVDVQEYADYGYHTRWPYGYGVYSMWPHAPVTYTDVNQYSEGTLLLDFVDARTKRLVFRGVARAVVADSQENAPKVREAVEQIVRAFPRSSSL